MGARRPDGQTAHRGRPGSPGRNGRTGNDLGTLGQRRAPVRVESPSRTRARSRHADPRAAIRRPPERGLALGCVMTKSALQRLGGVLLPSSPAGRTLAIGAGIDSLGTGMFFASFALYFVGVVGIAATEVALAATIAGAVAHLAPLPRGPPAYRL